MNQLWYESLKEQIRNWPSDASLGCESMFQVELGLYLLQTLGDLPVGVLPFLLKGHVQTQSESEQNLILRARHHIPQYAREPVWEWK